MIRAASGTVAPVTAGPNGATTRGHDAGRAPGRTAISGMRRV